METVDYTMKVPKEGSELVDTTMKLLKHFKNGGNLTEAVAFLADIAKAVDGAAQVITEMKSDYNDELVAFAVHKLWDALK